MSKKSELMKIEKIINESDKETKMVFNLQHSNSKNTLNTDLILTKQGGSWKATVDLSDFPDCSSANDAAIKLAEWLKRLSESIPTTNYNQINTNSL